MGDPLRAKETFARVVSEYAAAPQARRSELYLEFIQRRYGDNPQPAHHLAGIARARLHSWLTRIRARCASS